MVPSILFTWSWEACDDVTQRQGMWGNNIPSEISPDPSGVIYITRYVVSVLIKG